MKRNRFLLHTLAILGAGLVAANATAAPTPARIGVVDDYKTTIYCLGATDANKGVYTMDKDGNATKISGSTYIQYSFLNSGGTFTSPEQLYGTYSNYGSIYCVAANAAGTADGGPWDHSYMAWRDNNNMSYPATYTATDMTWDPTEEKIYGVFKTSAYGYTYTLGIYDGEAHTVTTVATLASTVHALACDADGQLWGITGDNGALVKIDKSTGALTTVGGTGVYTTQPNQSAVIDSKTGKMYWAAKPSMYATNQSFYEVDMSAGTATKICELAGVFNGFYIEAPKADPNAPGDIENLTAEFTLTGTDVKVGFTMPSRNFGGSGLSGDITWTITSDGQSVLTGTAQPGEQVEKVITLEAGEHNITVYATQNELNGPAAKTKVYAGFDTPTNITNLTCTVDGSNVALTWDAPTAAHELGVLNPEALTYTVTRNPGNEEVATGLKVCEASDVIPAGLAKKYSWTVTVKYEGAEDQSMTTASTLVGDPYQIPYSENFENAETLDDVVFSQFSDDSGNNGGSPVWLIEQNAEQTNKYAAVASQAYKDHGDYLFTAPLALEKGAIYTVKFKAALSAVSRTNYDWQTQSYVPDPHLLDVYLTKGQSAAAEDVVEPKLAESPIKLQIGNDETDKIGVFADYSYTFSVEENGTYCICLADVTESFYHHNISLMIDDIEVTGEYATPAAVENLTAETSELGSRDVNVKFNLPTKTADDAELYGLTKAELYRGEELLTTFAEDLKPGDELTYTDQNAPRGLLNYSVKVYLHDNASAAANASCRSGYLNNLEIVSCTVPETIEENGTAKVDVKIVNNAFEQALDYRVVLMIDGKEADAKVGEPLAEDQEADYSFEILWNADGPRQVKLQVMIEYFGDENTDNNTSDEYTLNFAQVGIGSLNGASGVRLTTSNGVLSIHNANGMKVTVHSTDGRRVASAVARGNRHDMTPGKGVYIVTIGNKSFKVNL